MKKVSKKEMKHKDKDDMMLKEQQQNSFSAKQNIQLEKENQELF